MDSETIRKRKKRPKYNPMRIAAFATAATVLAGGGYWGTSKLLSKPSQNNVVPETEEEKKTIIIGDDTNTDTHLDTGSLSILDTEATETVLETEEDDISGRIYEINKLTGEIDKNKENEELTKNSINVGISAYTDKNGRIRMIEVSELFTGENKETYYYEDDLPIYALIDGADTTGYYMHESKVVGVVAEPKDDHVGDEINDPEEKDQEVAKAAASYLSTAYSAILKDKKDEQDAEEKESEAKAAEEAANAEDENDVEQVASAEGTDTDSTKPGAEGSTSAEGSTTADGSTGTNTGSASGTGSAESTAAGGTGTTGTGTGSGTGSYTGGGSSSGSGSGSSSGSYAGGGSSSGSSSGSYAGGGSSSGSSSGSYAGGGSSSGSGSGSSSGSGSGSSSGSGSGSGSGSSSASAVVPTKIVFPNITSTTLTDADVASLSSDELQMAIDELFARNGYMFGNTSTQNFYSQYDWYNPTSYNAYLTYKSLDRVEQLNFEKLYKKLTGNSVSTTTTQYLPDSSSRVISDDEISALGSNAVLALDEIYARNGFKFGRQVVYDHFDDFAWYMPDASKFTTIEKRFNEYELANYKKLVAYIRKNGY